MGERLKFVLFLVFSLTVFWFTIILLCLPQSEPWPPTAAQDVAVLDEPSISYINHPDHDHHLERSGKIRRSEFRRQGNVPESADVMRYFRPRPLTLMETLFYEFNPTQSLKSLNSSRLTVSESDHKSASLELASLNGPTEHYVKSRGNSLFSFNLLASNRVGLLRPLPDSRPVKCPKEMKPVATNYTATIVICYYKEAPSALLRTVYSILARTPLEMLNEIIIVDDFSESGYDMDTIQPFLKHLGGNGGELVRFVRTSKREGLIRARLFGAAMAKGDVLIFLDSHVEANAGWFEPLMEIIRENKTTIACPMIDLINAETMLYTASPMVKGGLTWALHFKWASVPASNLKTYEDFVKPIESPTMAGGLYAIHRDYFYHLGAYDPGMNLWGGENIELSLKAWMCGGRVLILPCSRLGHIFRKTRPYGPKPNEPDSLTYNSHRVARVWLDEYINKYYELVPQTRQLDSGDISERVEIRERLKCQNFTWFLDNVNPEMRGELLKGESSDGQSTTNQKKPGNLFNSKRINRSVGSPDEFIRRTLSDMLPHQGVPMLRKTLLQQGRNIAPDDFLPPTNRQVRVLSRFQIQLHNTKLCLEPKVSFIGGAFTRLVLNDCAPLEDLHMNSPNVSHLQSRQIWAETELQDIRLGHDQCLDIMKNLPLLRRCHNMKSHQAWTHFNQTQATYIMSSSSGDLCLAVERIQRDEPVIFTICDMESYSRNGHKRSPPVADKFNRQQRLQRPMSQQSAPMIFDRNARSWYTGPLLSMLESPKQRKRRTLEPSLKLHQIWNLIVIHDSK